MRWRSLNSQAHFRPRWPRGDSSGRGAGLLPAFGHCGPPVCGSTALTGLRLMSHRTCTGTAPRPRSRGQGAGRTGQKGQEEKAWGPGAVATKSSVCWVCLLSILKQLPMPENCRNLQGWGDHFIRGNWHFPLQSGELLEGPGKASCQEPGGGRAGLPRGPTLSSHHPPADVLRDPLKGHVCGHTFSLPSAPLPGHWLIS